MLPQNCMVSVTGTVMLVQSNEPAQNPRPRVTSSSARLLGVLHVLTGLVVIAASCLQLVVSHTSYFILFIIAGIQVTFISTFNYILKSICDFLINHSWFNSLFPLTILIHNFCIWSKMSLGRSSMKNFNFLSKTTHSKSSTGDLSKKHLFGPFLKAMQLGDGVIYF